MFESLRLYKRYLLISLRGQMQYRASFIMQAVGYMLVTGIEFLGVWALFDRFGNLAGWRLPEVAFFYGLSSTIFSLSDCCTRGFEIFGETVKSGDFDRVLVRPRSTILQLAGQELRLRQTGRLVQGLCVLGWAIATLGIAWTLPKFVLFAAAIAGGMCLFGGLMVLQATMCFWTTETLEVVNAFTYGGEYICEYPMAIFRPWFRKFFTFAIPLACITYFPGVAIMGHRDPLGTPIIWHWMAPLAGPAFLGASLLVWRIGVRRYRSTGS